MRQSRYFFRIFSLFFIATILGGLEPVFGQGKNGKNPVRITLPFETDSNQTVTYSEAIAAYEGLARRYPKQFRLQTWGQTDSGFPLHLGVLAVDGQFEPEKIRKADRRVILVCNGIHPGEPEGIDASILLIRDLLENPKKQAEIQGVVVLFIPIYNIGGALQRNSHSRANQNGPAAYGFRGNAKNYDLNRDFIKTDSKNARAFAEIFHHWKPDVFMDNHTSNGADYPYTMTLIATLHNKLEAPLGAFLDKKMVPALYADMERKGWPMAPYVNTFSETPDSGLVGFYDLPRYSTGYTTLWNCIGFVPETHMLKPFAQRLRSTYSLMESVFEFTAKNREEIGTLRRQANENAARAQSLTLHWKMDPNQAESFRFRGYAAKSKASLVSGAPRLYYDQTEPWERDIPFYNTYIPVLQRTKPKAYLIPQAWTEVLDLLRLNQVPLRVLQRDTTVQTRSYFIRKTETVANPWEGHYYHHKVTLEEKTMTRSFRKGDVLVLMGSPSDRYAVECLEPDAPDSYLAWNFFDPVLMQKEYFSSYVFEDLAADFLEKNPAVRAELEQKKQNDSDFAKNPAAQLDWVYRKSPWFEPTWQLYPVARLE